MVQVGGKTEPNREPTDLGKFGSVPMSLGSIHDSRRYKAY